MYYRNEPRHAVGQATMVLRQLGDKVGARERRILEAFDVVAVRWDGSPTDCIEFSVAGVGACVVRRTAGGLQIVG